jgi:uncharacterized protein (TIGR02145 family)
MKEQNWFSKLFQISFVLGMLLICNSECKKTTENVSIPVLTTAGVTGITSNSANCGGNISSDGGATVTACGVCWSTSQNPSVSDNKTSDFTGSVTFSSLITGLSPATPYYVRAYATNSAGTGYGNIRTFSTLAVEPGTIVDIDGNVYHKVTINSQVWLVENLKVTHYRNGDTISHNRSLSQSAIDDPVGEYWNYNNSDSLGNIYGRLYNFYAIADPRLIAPLGWHVASDADWTELANHLLPDSTVGGKLKETGTLHWLSPNIGATNETGFTALPGGNYNPVTGFFSFLGYGTSLWSSTESVTNSYAFGRSILNNSGYLNHGESPKFGGMSVRCLEGE